MALLVIVLCLLSERFWAHARVHQRFHWFIAYGARLSFSLRSMFSRMPSWGILAGVVLPILLVAMFVLHMVDHALFGVIGLLCSLAIFYYCLGPVNPFYPAHEKGKSDLTNEDLGAYLVAVNGQLFAVLFWYIVAGPIGIMAYRLISLACNLSPVRREASLLTDILDWMPVRMTALLYLLVGHFQAGLSVYRKQFFSRPSQNSAFLSDCGIAAMNLEHHKKKSMRSAERLVEHATIVFLLLLALCTLVTWF